MFQPLFVRSLTPDERKGLDDYSKSVNKEEGIRARVILASAERRTAIEISQSLGSHPSNIKKWIRKFNAQGLEGISAKKRGPQGGPRPSFKTAQIEAMLKFCEYATEVWPDTALRNGLHRSSQMRPRSGVS